jgi:hypothetical protein
MLGPLVNEIPSKVRKTNQVMDVIGWKRRKVIGTSRHGWATRQIDSIG